MAGEDFVHVKLSKKGEEMAGGGELVVCNHLTWRFRAGQAQRVPRAFDWNQVLSKEMIGGEPLFEISEKPAAPAVSAPAANKGA